MHWITGMEETGNPFDQFQDGDEVVVHLDGDDTRTFVWRRVSEGVGQLLPAGARCRCGHPSDDTWFDREVCPDPCGMMHTRCKGCGTDADGCYWDDWGSDGEAI